MSKINHDLRSYRLSELTLRLTIVGVAGYLLALVGMVMVSASLVLMGTVLMGWAALKGLKGRL